MHKCDQNCLTVAISLYVVPYLVSCVDVEQHFRDFDDVKAHRIVHPIDNYFSADYYFSFRVKQELLVVLITSL